MSMRDIMSRLRKEDPDFARSIQRLRVFSIGIAAVAFLALMFAVASNLVNFGQANDITNVNQHVTKIERSACQRSNDHPGDGKAAKECAEIRAHIARSEPVENPCISYQRVTGERGRNCDGFFVDVGRGGRAESIDAAPVRNAASEVGDASQSPSSATQQPAPGSPAHTGGGGGSTKVAPQGDGHKKSPENLTPTETGSPAGQEHGAAAPTSTASSESSTTIVTSESELAPKEPVREVLGTATAPVGGTVETVTGKACEATGLLCTK